MKNTIRNITRKAIRAQIKKASFELAPGVIDVSAFLEDKKAAREMMLYSLIRSVTLYDVCCDTLPGYNVLTRREKAKIYDTVRAKVEKCAFEYAKELQKKEEIRA